MFDVVTLAKNCLACGLFFLMWVSCIDISLLKLFLSISEKKSSIHNLEVEFGLVYMKKLMKTKYGKGA